MAPTISSEPSAISRHWGLTSMLRHEVVGIPDAQVKALIETRVGETRHLDELTEEYERERHEHEAWVALPAHFPGAEAITDD
jgi:hypothetical protein